MAELFRHLNDFYMTEEASEDSAFSQWSRQNSDRSRAGARATSPPPPLRLPPLPVSGASHFVLTFISSHSDTELDAIATRFNPARSDPA